MNPLIIVSINIISVEAIAGQSVEIPCNVTTESPEQQLQILAWYKNGTKAAIYG